MNGLKFDKKQFQTGFADKIRAAKQELIIYIQNTIIPEILNDIAVKGAYTDRTTALRTSRGAVLFVDGQEVHRNTTDTEGEAGANAAIATLSNQIPNGIALIVVVGMEYGIYVEAKGFNVLYESSERLKSDWKEAIDRIFKEHGLL